MVGVDPAGRLAFFAQLVGDAGEDFVPEKTCLKLLL
jgi:hypothetical protein